MDAFSDISGGV